MKLRILSLCKLSILVLVFSGCTLGGQTSRSASDNSSGAGEGARIITSDAEQGYANLQLLFNQGYLELGMEQLSVLRELYPDFASAKNFEERLINKPFLSAVDLARRHTRYLLTRPSQLPPFTLREPIKPSLPEAPILTRGEFERRADFNTRIQVERSNYLTNVKELQETYKQEVLEYNTAVSNYNADLAWEVENRRDYVINNRWEYMARALQNILGDPILADMRYDVDARRYYGRLVSSEGRFDEYISIGLPVDEARELNSNLEQAVPRLSFSVGDDGKLKFDGVQVVFGGSSYKGDLLREPYIPESTTPVQVASATLGVGIAETEEGTAETASVSSVSAKGTIQIVELGDLIEEALRDFNDEALVPINALELDELLKESDEFFDKFLPETDAIDFYTN